MSDEQIADHATEVIAWLHSEEARGWTYNDLELRIRLAIRGALADTRLSDHSRRIAELEQANRDLERLRVVASRERDEARERTIVAEQQEREAKEAEARAWEFVRSQRAQNASVHEEVARWKQRWEWADQARITFRDKLYGEKAVANS